jgi:hypothetical protein
MVRYVSRNGTILEQQKGSQWVKLYFPDGRSKKVIGQLTKDSVEAIVVYSAQPIEQVRRTK